VLILVTTLLDALGLLLLAAGTTGGLWPLIGAAALAPAGAVVLAGSWLATRQQRAEAQR
jgi:hypothetical protein